MERAPEIFAEFLQKHGGSKIAIATHSRPDTDAIASAFALSKLLPGSVICTDEEMNEGARLLAEKLGIKTVPLPSADPKDFDGMAIVDTSAYVLIPQAKSWKVLLVIDHHRAEGRDIQGQYEIIDPSSPSTAEIIAGLGMELDKDAAFALSAGIIADAARFKSARAATFETLGRLMGISGADYEELLCIAEPEPKEEAKIAILTAMKRVEFVYAGGYLIAVTEVGSNESDVASLLAEAADVAFVAKWKNQEKETRISARARPGVKVPLNEVMAEVGRELGGAGGGHAKASGAALKVHTDEALKTCVDVFVRMAESR